MKMAGLEYDGRGAMHMRRLDQDDTPVLWLHAGPSHGSE
jgi:hypothetical protein